jgi:hypothetical protein
MKIFRSHQRLHTTIFFLKKKTSAARPFVAAQHDAALNSTCYHFSTHARLLPAGASISQLFHFIPAIGYGIFSLCPLGLV